MSPALPRLTAAEALARGWRREETPTGRVRLVDPEGRHYVPTTPACAVLVILPETDGLPPIHLRRPARWPGLRALQHRANQGAPR